MFRFLNWLGKFMTNDNECEDFKLQPIDHLVDSSQSQRDESSRANLHMQLTDLCEEAENGALLTLADLQSQFGVRHLLMLTATAAVLMFAYMNWGLDMAAHFSIPCVLIWAWICLSARERQRQHAVQRRIQELAPDLSDDDLAGIDISTAWRLSNSNLR